MAPFLPFLPGRIGKVLRLRNNSRFITVTVLLRMRRSQKTYQANSDQQRCNGRPMCKPPRQSSANGERGCGIGDASILQTVEDSMCAILRGFRCLLDQLVLRLTRLCPQILLEIRDRAALAQPSQIADKFRARPLDVPL